jgi:hypothetical protein
LGEQPLVPDHDPNDDRPDSCNTAGILRQTTVIPLPRETHRYSPEARAAISARVSEAMRDKVEAGLFVPSSKDPTVAAKISAAHSR